MGGGEKKDKKFIQKLLSQIKSGKKNLKVVNDKDGTLNYNQHETKLEPSGRQIDFALYYILY